MHDLHIISRRRFAAGGAFDLGWRLGLAAGPEAGLGSFGSRGQGCRLVAFLRLLRSLLRLLELGDRGVDVTFHLE